MSTVQALFNVLLLIFIVTTMLAAGLMTTLPMLAATLRRWVLVVLVLAANLVLIPLAGWGIAAVLGLSSASFIALVMLASSPGGPFGAKLAMVQHGDVTAGASLQVLLAAIGSLTFPITLNLILGWAKVGGNVSIPVGRLVATVAFLQLIPFAVGVILRANTEALANEWQPAVLKISNLSFIVVLAMALLGSFQKIVDLVGSKTLVAGVLFGIACMVIGYLLTTGPATTRTTMLGVAPVRNAGPVFAAIAVAYQNNADILGAFVAENILAVVLVVVVVSVITRRRAAAAPTVADVVGAPAARVVAPRAS